MSTTTIPEQRDALSARLARVLEVHFDALRGTPYWLERAAATGFDATSVRSLDDLAPLGDMTPADLTGRPLTDFIPRRFHGRLDEFIIGQTGGTSAMASGTANGFGTWTAYRLDEFREAFIAPFVEAAAHVGFPQCEPWLFVGPSGPHVIGKVVGHLAASMQSPDPFSVDFDPRWAKRMPAGSFAQQRYLDHVIEQAMAVIESQYIGVLFTTPPVLAALAGTMTRDQRLRIRGVHYGGLPVSPAQLETFQVEDFPNAQHICGYGNTLLGCCLELSTDAGRQLEYFPLGHRLFFEVIDGSGAPLPLGKRGQVRVSRLDESMLIIRMRERDHGELVMPSSHAPQRFQLPGIRNPDSPATTAKGRGDVGLY